MAGPRKAGEFQSDAEKQGLAPRSDDVLLAPKAAGGKHGDSHLSARQRRKGAVVRKSDCPLSAFSLAVNGATRQVAGMDWLLPLLLALFGAGLVPGVGLAGPDGRAGVTKIGRASCR